MSSDAFAGAPEIIVLEAIFAYWVRTERWPAVEYIDRPLHADGIDVHQVVKGMHPALIHWDQVGEPPFVLVRPTLKGLCQVPSGVAAGDQFVSVVRYLARAELEYDPSASQEQLLVSSEGIWSAIADRVPDEGSETQILALMGALIKGESPLWNYFNQEPEDPSRWRVGPSRSLRKFGEVQNLDEYFEAMETIRPSGPDGRGATEQPAVSPGVDPRHVFIVHGRDSSAKEAVSGFLRDLDLRPLEWEELVGATGTAAPYVGSIVNVAFQKAHAVIVLLTPDDEVRLQPDLCNDREPVHEVEWTGQARPNVLFEAGMALATHPDRTILVEIGQLRPFTDISGIHLVRLTGAASSTHALMCRLRDAGCPVNINGSDWLAEGRFRNLAAHSRTVTPVRPATSSTLPKGTVLGPGVVRPAAPSLTVRLLPHGGRSSARGI